MEGHTLDRDRLYDALNMCSAEKLYAWSTTLKRPPNLASIGINKVGDVKLPLDFERLRELCNRLICPTLQSGPTVVNTWDLFPPKSNETSQNEVFKELAEMAVSEMFNIDTQDFIINIHAVLDKLVICCNDEIYHGVFNIGKEPGTFGSLILQVPVGGIRGGAHIKVQYNQETMLMEHDVCSETNYYLTAVAGKRIDDSNVRQEFTIKAANNQQPCVLLIANLIWEDAIDSVPTVDADRFPQFIEAAYQTNRALSGWRHVTLNSSNEQQIKRNDEILSANTNAINPTGHFFIESSFESKLPLLNACQTKALCIPLRENYCLENYCFSSLKGDDALIIPILRSISYLAIDLVLVNKMKFPATDWRKCALLKTEETVNVFTPYSKEVVDHVPITLTTGQNFVGNLTAGITCSQFSIEKCSSCTAQQQCQVFYAAFLVRSKCFENVPEDSAKFVLNKLINRPPTAQTYESSLNFVNNLSCKNMRRQIIDTFKTKGWINWKGSLFFKILFNTHISRTFLGLTQLAMECHYMNCKEGVATISASMTQLFAKSVIQGGSRTALPHLVNLMRAFEIFTPSHEHFIQSVKEAINALTAAHLASVIDQNQNDENARHVEILGRLLLEKSFNDLTPTQLFKVVDTFLNLNDMETVKSLWSKVCDDATTRNGQLLRSMVMSPKEDGVREALVTHLASFSQFTKEALDALIESMEVKCDITLDSLTELFLFLISAESNELLASPARTRHFFAFLFRVDLGVLCLLPGKLCKHPLVEQANGHEMLKALIKALINDCFKSILNLEDRMVVAGFVDSIFYFRNEELINLFINQVILLDRNVDACFQSSPFNRYVIDLVQGTETIEEKILIHLIKLWIPNVYDFSKKFGLSGSTLSKAFFYCFPNDADAMLSQSFKNLLSNSNPGVLINFLKEIGEKLVNGKEDKSLYLDVLSVAIKTLIEERHVLIRAPLERTMHVMKVALWLDDAATISNLTPFLASKQSNILRQDVLDEESSSVITENVIDNHIEHVKESCNPVKDAAVPIDNKIPETIEKDIDKDQDSFDDLKEASVLQSKKLETNGCRDRECQDQSNDAVHQKGDTVANRFQELENSWTFEFPITKEHVPSFLCVLVEKPMPSEPDASHNVNVVTDSDECTLPKRRRRFRKRRRGGGTIIETWSIEDAVVRGNAVLQKFLRSDIESQRFPLKALRNLQQAQNYSDHLLTISPWPIHVEMVSVPGGTYFCQVTKAKKKQVLSFERSSDTPAMTNNGPVHPIHPVNEVIPSPYHTRTNCTVLPPVDGFCQNAPAHPYEPPIKKQKVRDIHHLV